MPVIYISALSGKINKETKLLYEVSEKFKVFNFRSDIMKTLLFKYMTFFNSAQSIKNR